MRSFILFLIIFFFTSVSSYAGYGGWIDIFTNSKEHKFCGDLARSRSSNPYVQEQIYYRCRSDIDTEKNFQNWKKNTK